jgi:gliding motility-associated-like protein/uncharacterized repeat protein (TIGR01451 family)
MVGGLAAIAQQYGSNVRYVQCNSVHALSVPENPDYSFEWSMTRGFTNIPMNINSTSNVTENITWDFCDTYYDISVYPILDSVGCKGEPIYMRIYTVDYLSLHAFNDVFFIQKNDTLRADVSTNDFDEMGFDLIYNPTLISNPRHGEVVMTAWGEFVYTPNPNFVGIDTFVYEVHNNANPDMYTNAMVTIVVKEPGKTANLYVEKIGPLKALIGGTIDYSIIVKNNGPDMAENVVLHDTVPFGLFNPTYLYNNQTEQPWNGTLSIGNLISGDSAVVSIMADISPNTPRGSFIYNQALTYSDVFDPDITDNDSIWITELLSLYVDLPDQLMVPGCRGVQLPNLSAGANKIVKYRWRPSSWLTDTTIANPWFVPDEYTVGGAYPYILEVTDSLGNVASDTITLVVSDLPVAAINGDTLFRDIGELLTINGNLSSGDRLAYVWSTLSGNIVGFQNRDSIVVDSLGIYRLRVRDALDCESVDSVLVLYESHNPVAVNDYIEIEAGQTDTMNVLANDYDINDFELHVSGIVTPPAHGDFEWDSLGNISYTPNLDAWKLGFDSLEYEVCNNGAPVMCSTAWMIIHILRPPLNADVVIAKSAEPIAFWGDTIRYNLLIYSNGPDTAAVIGLVDNIDGRYLIAPQYRTSVDNGATWSNWVIWKNSIEIKERLVPVTTTGGGNGYLVQIKAYIPDQSDSETGVTITNKAYITPAIDFLENDYTSDTSIVVTKIKEKVIARAGNDRTIGECQAEEGIELDGSSSGGENLTYHWSPERYFEEPDSAITTFRPFGAETGLVTIVLTVTDDDDIVSSDTLIVNVLPLPVANAGPDQFLWLGPEETVTLNGSGSLPGGSALRYQWSTQNGHLITGTDISNRAGADMLGTYFLTVTDKAGCTNIDTVEVYRYYYPPYPIPDYYSTTLGTPIVSDGVNFKSLLYNDFDPNRLFALNIIPVNNRITSGGRVSINSDGSFTYTPNLGFSGVDYFTYELCNGTPNGCARGYVKITVNNQAKIVNLSIDKRTTYESVLAGGEIVYIIEITNNSAEDQNSVVITDSLSNNIYNARYSFDGTNYPPGNVWSGQSPALTLNAGESRLFYIKGTVSPLAKGRIYNAAMVSSPTFDGFFDWDDEASRNVDTISVATENNLIARADLVERFDNNKLDDIIGVCDNTSFLTAAGSSATLPMTYNWQPNDFVTSDSTFTTTFNGMAQDTTIVFTLIVYAGENIKTADVTVHFSPEVIADAGPDRKMNEGQPLTLTPTGNRGAGVSYEWWNGDRMYTTSTRVLNFAGGDGLQPIVESPGQYFVYAKDMHGCEDADTVVISENQVFALNDILVVIMNDTVTANVGTNDYDPNVGDSIYFTGVVVNGPLHGTLFDDPPGIGGPNGNGGAKISNNGTYIYRPNPGYIGDDYFTYRVCDNNDPDLCVDAKVFIRVIDVDAVNSQPIANPDVYFVNKNDTLTNNLIANDYDFDGGTITIVATPVRPPQKGSVTINADGTFTYLPAPNAEGADSFYYRIFDNGSPSKFDTAMVAIYIHKIEGVNHKPVAVDDAYFVVGKTIFGNLMLNDYDPDGNDIAFDELRVVRPTNGVIYFLDQYGSFQYTPYDGYEGTDVMTYQIRELNSIEKYSTTATVYFTSLSESRYKTDLQITKTGPAAILSGSPIEYTLTVKVNGPTFANNVVISDTLSVAHIPANSFYSTNNGIDWEPWTDTIMIDRMQLYEEYSIRIRTQLIDTLSGNLSNVGWVGHNMVESKPANNRSEWITNVYQKVMANAGIDTLIGSCVEKFQLDGTASLGSGTLQYRWSPTRDLSNATTAKPTYTTTPGKDETFTLIVSSTYNGFTSSDTTTVEVYVAKSPIADAGPEFWDAIGTIELNGQNSSGSIPISYLWWQTDKNNDVVVVDSTVSVSVNRGGKYYLTVTDTFGCTATDFTYIGYKIEPVVAIDDYIETPQDEVIDIRVLRNDIIDMEVEILTVVVSNDPAHGTVTWNSYDSTFSYTPELYFVGYDTFTYIVSTLYGGEDEAMVVVNVLNRPALVPEGFSPNGDGINDVLRIENIEKYPFNSLIVFNRWGSVIYKKEKYSNDDPWNGVANKGVRIGSGAVPSGVYLYILDLGNDNVKQREVKGNIYIATDNRH